VQVKVRGGSPGGRNETTGVGFVKYMKKYQGHRSVRLKDKVETKGQSEMPRPTALYFPPTWSVNI